MTGRVAAAMLVPVATPTFAFVMPSLPAKAVLGLIRLYKLTLSPLVGRDCRYLPTCSTYAADAVRAHGAWKGSWMAGARLCRCHPWGGSGYDPAPTVTPKAPWFAPWRFGDWKGGVRAPSSLSHHTNGAEKLKMEEPR